MTYRKFRSNPAVIGAVCALGGFLARLPIASTLGATVPYITFYPAVVIGASLGGLAAGLLTAGLSILLAALLILPRGPQPVLSIRNGIAIAVFLAFSAFISWLNEALRRERKATSASEERMRLILANALDAVITIDEAGIITEWNQRAESTFGWSRTDALGRRLRDTVIPPQYREAHEQGVKRYLATRQSSMLDRRIEITGLHRDGREFPVELAITPIQQGDKIGFSAFVRDITSRKQAEARVQTQLARLELLSRTTRAIGERQDLQSILQVVVQNLEDHLALDFVCVSLCDADKKSLSVAAIGAKSQTAGSTLGVAPQATIDVGENGLSSCVRGRLVYEPDSAEVPHPLPARLARAGLRSLVFAPLLVEDDILGVLITARRQPHAFSSVD